MWKLRRKRMWEKVSDELELKRSYSFHVNSPMSSLFQNTGDVLFFEQMFLKQMRHFIADRMILLLYHDRAWANARTNLNTV